MKNIHYAALYAPEHNKVVLITEIDVTGRNHVDSAIRTSSIMYSYQEVIDRLRAMEGLRSTLSKDEFENVIAPYSLCMDQFVAAGITA